MRDAQTLQPIAGFSQSGSDVDDDGSRGVSLFQGQVASLSIKGDLLIASGYTSFEQPLRGTTVDAPQMETVYVPDPFVKVLDLRTFKQLPPVAYSARLVSGMAGPVAPRFAFVSSAQSRRSPFFSPYVPLSACVLNVGVCVCTRACLRACPGGWLAACLLFVPALSARAAAAPTPQRSRGKARSASIFCRVFRRRSWPRRLRAGGSSSTRKAPAAALAAAATRRW